MERVRRGRRFGGKGEGREKVPVELTVGERTRGARRRYVLLSRREDGGRELVHTREPG